MRTLVASLFLLASCSSDPKSNFPDPSALYRIENGAVSCPDAAKVEEFPGPAIVCTWTCVTVGGEPVRSVGLTFRPVDGAWKETFATWDFGTCE